MKRKTPPSNSARKPTKVTAPVATVPISEPTPVRLAPPPPIPIRRMPASIPQSRANAASIAGQLPPVLHLHRLGSTYFLRIFDNNDAGIGLSVAKALHGAENLIVSTPTDTKVFNIGPARPQTGGNYAGVREAPEEASGEEGEGGEGSEEEAEDVAEAAYRAANSQEAIQDEELARASGFVDFQSQTDASSNNDEQEVSVRNNPARTRTRPKRAQAENAPNATCGRCGGHGQVSMLVEGGAAVTSDCPVCRGAGVIRYYGAKRS